MKIKKVGNSYTYCEGQFRRAIHKLWQELTGYHILPVDRKSSAEYLAAQIFMIRHGNGGIQGTESTGVDFVRTVNDYLKRCESRGHAAKTVTQQRQQLLGLKLRFVHQLTAEFIQKYLDTSDLSGASRNRYASTVNRFVHYCNKIGYIRTRFVVDRYPELKSDKGTVITPEVFRCLCEAAGGTFAHVMELAYHSGMRRGEIHFLWKNNWAQVDTEKRVAYFPAASIKNRIAKAVPLNARALAAIQALVGKRPYASADAITRQFERISTRIGEDIRFHDFRHTFVSRCRLIVTASIAARIVGHSDPRTTENIYTHYDLETMLGAVDSLPD